LQRGDRLPLFAPNEETAIADRGRRHPVPDLFFVQTLPREAFAGVLLALRCDVRVCKNSIGADVPTLDEVAAERDDAGDLLVRKGR
jgi:hypothetical protein